MQNKLAAIVDDVFIKASPPDDLIQLGHIAAAHGIRGLVKIQTYSDQSQALIKNKTWWLKAPDKNNRAANAKKQDQPSAQTGRSGFKKSPKSQHVDACYCIEVQSCNSHGQNTLLAKFTNIKDRNQAELLQFYSIYLSRADFPQEQTDEYYWVDLIGCEFYGMNYEPLENEQSNEIVVQTINEHDPEPATSNAEVNNTQAAGDSVTSADPVFLGMVDQVTENVAHAILDIVVGSKNENGEFIAKLDAKSRPVHVLVPFVSAHITDVNLQAKRIISNWPIDY